MSDRIAMLTFALASIVVGSMMLLFRARFSRLLNSIDALTYRNGRSGFVAERRRAAKRLINPDESPIATRDVRTVGWAFIGQAIPLLILSFFR